jgi:hypothetical protein
MKCADGWTDRHDLHFMRSVYRTHEEFHTCEGHSF